MSNLKTNIAALLFALLTIATAMGYITAEQATSIGAALAAFGFAVAKDHK